MNTLDYNKKGITLIALVITIVVLLILSAVTVVSIFGEDGIVEKANWSAFLTEFSAVQEAIDMKEIEKQIDKKSKNTTTRIATIEEIATIKIAEIESESTQTAEKEYPVKENEKINNGELEETLVNTIKGIEGIENITEAELYKVDFTKLNLNIKNEYIINVKSGKLYRVKGQRYKGKIYHRPDYAASKGEVEVANFKIEETSATIGKTKKLVAKLGTNVVINTDVEWSSSDANVLTVDENGNITGVNLGKVLLTGTLKSDSTKSETIEIDVTELIQAIYTKEDMEEFRTNVNTGSTYEGLTVNLMKNIDLLGGTSNVWETIGNGQVDGFMGTFEGNGNTINGLYVESVSYSQGLFGEVGNATIQNLKVNGFVQGNYYVGGIAGRINDVNIDNCEFSGTVIATGLETTNNASDAGGIVGRIGKDGGTITNCKNYASVEGKNDIGGIVGWHIKGIVENCNNYGTIKGTSWVGGITGTSGDDQYEEYEIIINNCINYGKTTGNQTGSIYVGGIIGFLAGNNSQVSNCNNEAEIICNGKNSQDDSDTGGILGATSGSGTNKKIEKCTNRGRVFSIGACTGGIIGWAKTGTIEDCQNQGNIVTDVGYTGGIAGNVGTSGGEYATINKCINSGKIESSNEVIYYGRVGGIVGELYGKIESCLNTGEIIGNVKDKNNNSRTGGIVGCINNYGGTVTYCYNTGKITSKYETVGGIAGSSSINNSNRKIKPAIEYCYNIGEIEASSYSGNVLGYNFDITSGGSNIDPIINCFYLEGKLTLTSEEPIETTSGEAKNSDGIKAIINLETWKDYFVKDKIPNINNDFPILNWQ